MRTIPEVVEKLVKRTPFIEEALVEGLINVSALARKFLPEIERELKKEVKLGAVVMALNRLPITLGEKISKKISFVIENIGDITVRSNLTDFTFSNSSSLVESRRTLLNRVSKKGNFFFTVCHGVTETTLVLSSVLEDDVKEVFENENLVSTTSHLASVTVKLPKNNLTTPGLYYFMFKRVADQGINVVEIISTGQEVTIIVQEEDVEEAFSIMKNLCK
ncbi:MAG: aspartate kinase [Bacteroidales bacterium]|jgi:aspartokinase|nr:aspartate kinase [Bacteroidales bacterium]